MTTFIIRRLFLGIIVLLIASLLVFVMMRMLPGDPLTLFLGDQVNNMDPAEIAKLHHQYGLDKPVIVQYFDWVGNALKGDLGQSVQYETSVGNELKHRLPVTLNLTILALLLSTILGPALGTIAAVRRNKWQDNTISVLANLGITLPSFWVAIMVVLVSYKLHFSDVTKGYVSPFTDFGMHVRLIILPVLVLSLFGTAAQTRQARSSMLEAAQQDYIRTAWSKGLRERVVVFRHMLKNGLIPVVTTMGMQVSFLFGGSVVVEKIFNIPGIGRMLADGVMERDYQMVQGAVLMMAVIIVLTNLLVDVAYAWIDPRIRDSYR